MENDTQRHTPVSTTELLGGVRHHYEFPNGYGASVVRHQYSYGADDGLWELAVLGRDGHLTYDTDITNDVEGWLTWDEVEALLDSIATLGTTEESND